MAIMGLLSSGFDRDHNVAQHPATMIGEVAFDQRKGQDICCSRLVPPLRIQLGDRFIINESDRQLRPALADGS